MKSVSNIEKTHREYPKLMITKDADDLFVILFINEDSGVIVHVFTSNKNRKVGQFDRAWLSSCFIDFAGSITLSND